MSRVLISGALLLAAAGWLASTANAAAVPAAATVLTSARMNRAVLDGDCTTPAAAPACCTPAVPCCPTPTITYRHHCPHRKICCGCPQPEQLKIVLQAKNPCTGCPVEIPLCIPGCTTGEAKVCSGTGIFCRDLLLYEWCNGYRVKVAFLRCGDVIVTTYGS